MNKTAAYLAGHKACGLHEDDWVLIKQKAEHYEGGWGALWVEKMDKNIGKVGKIVADKEMCGYRVRRGNTEYNYPWFVLEPAEPEPEEQYDDILYGLDFTDQASMQILVDRLFKMIHEWKK